MFFLSNSPVYILLRLKVTNNEGQADLSDRMSADRVLGLTLTLLHSVSLSPKYGHFWLPKTKMATAEMSNSRLQNRQVTSQ